VHNAERGIGGVDEVAADDDEHAEEERGAREEKETPLPRAHCGVQDYLEKAHERGALRLLHQVPRRADEEEREAEAHRHARYDERGKEAVLNGDADGGLPIHSELSEVGVRNCSADVDAPVEEAEELLLLLHLRRDPHIELVRAEDDNVRLDAAGTHRDADEETDEEDPARLYRGMCSDNAQREPTNVHDAEQADRAVPPAEPVRDPSSKKRGNVV
jgi:hypothetical protein